MKAPKILVTAGPTREPIDPVRFISNYSTATMGYAIATAAREKGYRVIIISGPATLKKPYGIKIVSVTTAAEMFRAVKTYERWADCIIMAAAVSDFRPAVSYSRKLKRKNTPLTIKLVPNPDILHWLGAKKKNKILVGFCMETEKLVLNAKKKLESKNLDVIVANAVDRHRLVFGPGRTSVVIIERDNLTPLKLYRLTKKRIAGILLDKIEKLWYKKASLINKR